MSAEDLHEIQFKWPHPEPNTVIVTGTFDDWSSSIYLTKTPAGFEGTTKIPWGEKIKFKFVVDGKWIVHEDQPTEIDPGGFVNNVYKAPPHPSNAEVAEPVMEDVQPTTSGHLANGHTLAVKAVENLAEEHAGESAADDKPIGDLAKAEDKVVASSEHQDIPPPGFPQLLSDLANTIVARDGTSSALDYVASGLGAAMHGVVGMDPVNIQKIAIPTPVSDNGFTLPRVQESLPVTAELASDSAPPSAADSDTPVSPLAPRVRIAIVPVNAAENNTVPSSSPSTELSSPIPIPGPAVVVTEPPPTPPAAPQIKSEAIFAPIFPVVEADAQPSAEVEQEKAIEAEMPSENTVAVPVNLEVVSVAAPEPGTFSNSKGPEPRATTLSVTGPEPVQAAAESDVEPETTTAAETSPTTAKVEAAAPTEADVPAVSKAQPEESSTATESTTEPEATPTSAELVPATTEATPFPDGTTGVREPQQITAPLYKPEVVAVPVSDVVQPTVVEGLSAFEVPEPGPGPVPVAGAPTMEANVDVVPLVEVPRAEDAPAIFVEEPEVEELVVEANIVKDEDQAPVLGRTPPVAINETLAPEPNSPTGLLLEATAVEHVKLTDTPIIVKSEKVTGVEYAAIAEPAVEGQVVDAKLEEIESNDPDSIIEPVPTTVIENIKPVESLSVVQRSLREFAPVSQELIPEPSVESTPVMTESTDAAEVEEIKPLRPGVTCEVGKSSASELKVDEIVEATPTAVVTAVEARTPPAANEPVAIEPFPVVDEVTLTKAHGEAEANGSTTTDPGARDQMSTNGHGAPPAATTSTQEGATHAEKFPSASVSHPVSEDNTPSSSKFNSTRKKRTSIFGKLKNIFHQDKEKEKK